VSPSKAKAHPAKAPQEQPPPEPEAPDEEAPDEVVAEPDEEKAAHEEEHEVLAETPEPEPEAEVEAEVDTSLVTKHDNEIGCSAGRVWRRRSDDDVLTGEFCRVVGGPHTGRYGVMETIAAEENGWPAVVIVKTRDDQDMRIHVDYADIRPDVAGKR
jgi:hypothetical protein